MSLWDTVVASASAAAASSAKATGEATAVVATLAKLSADLLVIDRDITARMEKFGVETYAHLESITSTQEFYVADDRLINIIKPTLIRAQREVAAYERKRDAMNMQQSKTTAPRQQQYPAIIDPLDSIPIPGATTSSAAAMPFSYSMGSGSSVATPEWMPQSEPHVNAAAPDWFSLFDATDNSTQSNSNFGGKQSSGGLHHRGGNQNNQHNNCGSNEPSLNDADMSLFQY
jgi:hypothetical protein